MTDYSNAANFLNPLPAYPIKHSCKYLTTPNAEERALIKTIYEGIQFSNDNSGFFKTNSSSFFVFSASSVYYNFTGTTFLYFR